MWKLKYDTNVLINETETDSQAQRTDLWLPKKVEWGRDGLGCKLIYIYRMDKQQGPTVQPMELYSLSCKQP